MIFGFDVCFVMMMFGQPCRGAHTDQSHDVDVGAAVIPPKTFSLFSSAA